MKQKAFLIIFKGFSVAKNCLRPESAPFEKLMVEELQVGGAPIKHAEHWKAPKIAEFAFKYTTLTLKKTFDSNNKRDALQRLKDVIHSMRRKTRANAEAVKCYLSLNMNFYKSKSPGVKTDSTVTFHSEVFMPVDTNRLNYQSHVGY